MTNEPGSAKLHADVARSTSRSLLAELKEDKSEAWQRMVTLYKPLVEFWCRRMHVPAQDVPDLTQDVFQTVSKSIHSFSKTQSTGTFRGWLRTITYSRVVDWRRRVRGKPAAAGGSAFQNLLAEQPFESAGLKSVEDDSAVEDQLVQQLYRQALAIIQDRFQEQTWRAFWRVVVDGRTPKEVAEELSMQPGAVRVAKSRVLHRLRAELGELIED